MREKGVFGERVEIVVVKNGRRMRVSGNVFYRLKRYLLRWWKK